jgi:hypothetical protein
MKTSVWSLIHRQAERVDHEKTLGEGGHWQTEDRDLARTQRSRHLDVRLSGSRAVKTEISNTFCI